MELYRRARGVLPSVFTFIRTVDQNQKEKPTALLGHFALRAPSRRVWRVDFGVMEWGVMRAAIPLGCCVVGVAES